MKHPFTSPGSRQCEHAEDTRQLGAELGACLEAGDVVILDGPLGAGKTTFTQGIAEGMGVKGRVTSPTFIIAREHRPLSSGKPTLVHVDAYRLLDTAGGTGAGALDSLDLESELEDAVVVAEWGGGVAEQLSDTYLLVSLDRETLVQRDPESEGRIISWSPRG